MGGRRRYKQAYRGRGIKVCSEHGGGYMRIADVTIVGIIRVCFYRKLLFE
jgi:hypothetical protein